MKVGDKIHWKNENGTVDTSIVYTIIPHPSGRKFAVQWYCEEKKTIQEVGSYTLEDFEKCAKHITKLDKALL